MQAMSRRTRLEKLEEIGRQLGDDVAMETELPETDEEEEKEDETCVDLDVKEVAEYGMKIFALEPKVISSSITNKSLTYHFNQGNLKYQISDPEIPIQKLENLIVESKL